MASKRFGTVLTNISLSDRFSALSDVKPPIETNPFYLKKPKGQISDADHPEESKPHRQVKIKVDPEDKENAQPMDVVMTKEVKPRTSDLTLEEELQLADAVKRRAHLNLLLNEKKVFRSHYKSHNRGLSRPMHTIKSSFGNRISGLVHNFRSNRGPYRRRYYKKPKVTKEELDYDLEMYMARAGQEEAL